MTEDNSSINEKIRNSFLKVKEDIKNQSDSINELKNSLEIKNKDILSLNSKINDIKTNLNQIKDFLANFKESSIGTNGVSAQWRTMHNGAQWRTMAHNDASKIEKIPKTVTSQTNLEFEKAILKLTDREFSVFLALYEISKEQGYTTYADLAKHLNLTDSPVRHSIIRLVEKGFPIEKERILNGKVSLFIKEGILSHSLIARLINLRKSYPDEQKTLLNSDIKEN